MNNIKIKFFTALIIIFSFIGIKINLNYKNLKDLKNNPEFQTKESLRILNDCFDLENKYKRAINKSIELIEYCLKEYGSKN